MAVLNNGVVDTLPLSKKSFPLPSVSKSFPMALQHSAGGAVEDGTAPLVCGGRDTSGKAVDKCFRYSHKTRAWTESGRMQDARLGHAASVHPDLGLVMTGGARTGNKQVGIVETTKDGKHFSRTLPALPVPNFVHCQVTVDSNTIMVFGGCIPGNCAYNAALKLNIAERKWKKLPNLPTGRHGPGCGLVSERGAPKRVVVAGGRGSGGITDKVEVLDLSTLTWSTGPPLPIKNHYMTSLPYRNTFYLLGGHIGSKLIDPIYRCEPETGHWTLLPYRLSATSYDFPAFIFKSPKGDP